MNDESLRELIQQSDVDVSPGFADSVMRQIEETDHARNSIETPTRWVWAGVAGAVLLIAAQWFAVSALVEWVVSVSPSELAISDSGLRRPVQMIMLIATLVCCSQVYKMYRLESGN